MRPLLAFLAAILCADGARADDDPFLPSPNTIDHVVTMQIVTRAPPPPGFGPGPARGGGGGGGLRRITHHGDWTRLDGHRDGRFVPVGHIGHAASVAVAMGSWDAAGRPARFLHLRRGPRAAAADAGWERQPARTGERRIVNGELCEIWDVGRNTARGLARSGCITDDGIEVSVRVVDRNGAEVFYAKAMSVERRSVRPEDVQPPAGLLDLASWVGRARLSSPDPTGAAVSPATYETVMRAAFGEPGGGTRTRRRHGAWLYRETLDAGRRRSLLVSNEAAGFHLFSDRRPDGAETLALWLQPRPQGAPWTEALGVAMGRHDRVLGETCAYFDVARGMPGVGFIECRAQDGVVLKEENVSAPGRPNGVFEAVRVRRGGVALASVLPPGDLLAPARWGLR